MAIVGGLDLHRKQITFDVLDSDTGEVRRGRISPADRQLFRDLLAWTARLALPAPAATYEPRRLRLQILAVAGRLVRTARRRILKIDPAWPWATRITTAHTRLTALPVP